MSRYVVDSSRFVRSSPPHRVGLGSGRIGVGSDPKVGSLWSDRSGQRGRVRIGRSDRPGRIGRIGRSDGSRRLSRVGSVGVGYVLTSTRYIHSFPCVRIDREHQMMLVEVDISLAFHQDFDAFKHDWMKHCFSVEFIPRWGRKCRID